MSKVYKKIELIGVSEKSYEDAIKNAVAKASESLHGLFMVRGRGTARQDSGRQGR